MIRVAFVRGKYLNMYEGQNFLFPRTSGISLTGISSHKPLHDTFPFQTKKLFSPLDILDYRISRYIANRTVGDLHGLFGLSKLTKGFDLFHTADPHYYFSYQLAKLRQKKQIKVLLSTSWETIAFNNEGTNAKRKLKQFTENQVDHFVCPTQKAKRALLKERVKNDRITVIPLGVDLKRFRPEKKKKSKKLTILFTGRLVEEKGILDLYEAFKKAQQEHNLKLKIVGDGPLKKRLMQMITNDHFDKSVSITEKEYKDMPRAYQEADIIVIPSKTTRTWEEQYGMVAVEAMASGIPIVAYSSGALPEVISKAGILIKEGDSNALTQAIRRLVTDGQLRLRFGTIARRRVERNFDSRKTILKYKTHYETLCRSTL